MLRYFLLLLSISLLFSPLASGAIGVAQSEEKEDLLIRQVTSRDQTQNDLTLDADYHHFAKFIEKFKKSYRSVEEHAHRFGVFKANLRRARRHQVLDPGAEHGVTQFSDLTPKEFERYLGLKKRGGLKGAAAAPILPTDGLPEEFDWRGGANFTSSLPYLHFLLLPLRSQREMMNMKPGDWNCRSCQHLNFSRRESCQRCGDPRSILCDFGGVRSGSSYGFMPGSDVRLGDWYCQCGTHNFASRSNCFKCNAFKDECAHVNCGGGFDVADIARLRGFAFGGAGRSGWKSGDWICTRFGCNEHNFASRHECFRCNAPRDYGTEI